MLGRILATASVLSVLAVGGFSNLPASPNTPVIPKGALHDLEFYPGVRTTPTFDWEVVDRTGKGDRLPWTKMPTTDKMPMLKESSPESGRKQSKEKPSWSTQPYHCSTLAGCRRA